MEPLWSVLETRVRSRFPTLSLKQLEEVWYSIPLGATQNLHEFIPRRIQAVLQAQLHFNKDMYLSLLFPLLLSIPCRNISLLVGVLFNSLPCLCSVMLFDVFVLLTSFYCNHFLLHSTHVLKSHLWLSNLNGKNPGVLSEVANIQLCTIKSVWY